MRSAALLAALPLFVSCGAPRRAEFPPPPLPPVAVVEVKNPNFELVVVEAVPNAGDDGVSLTQVFVDGTEAGRTPVGPRSQEKRVQLKLPAGNQPVRLEHWLLSPVGDWTRLPDAQQPRERFVRVEDGTLARLILRYAVDGAPSLQLSRDAAPH